MKLPKFLKNLGIAVAIGLASYFPVKSQTINGIITDLYTGAPVDNALVWVEDLGESYTDENGFYQIPPSGVEPYFFIPEQRIPNKLEIVNILGQKVLSKNISLEDITQDNFLRININNVASGNYPFRILDEDNKLYASGLAPIIEGNISLVPFSINTKKNYNKEGRSINSLDDYLWFTVEKDGYFFRETSIPEFTGSYVHDETVIEGDSLFLAFVNDVCQRGVEFGSVRYTIDPTYVIWPYWIQNGNPLPDSSVNEVIRAIDSVAFYSEELFNGIVTGHYEIVDSLPAPGTPDMIRVYWDNSIPWPATVSIGPNWSTHEVMYSTVRFKFTNPSFCIILQEITQALGPINNSNIIVPTVFGSSGTGQYYEYDKRLLKGLYYRETVPYGWISEDKDKLPWWE